MHAHGQGHLKKTFLTTHTYFTSRDGNKWSSWLDQIGRQVRCPKGNVGYRMAEAHQENQEGIPELSLQPPANIEEPQIPTPNSDDGNESVKAPPENQGGGFP